jgi:hypothetical protein
VGVWEQWGSRRRRDARLGRHVPHNAVAPVAPYPWDNAVRWVAVQSGAEASPSMTTVQSKTARLGMGLAATARVPPALAGDDEDEEMPLLDPQSWRASARRAGEHEHEQHEYRGHPLACAGDAGARGPYVAPRRLSWTRRRRGTHGSRGSRMRWTWTSCGRWRRTHGGWLRTSVRRWRWGRLMRRRRKEDKHPGDGRSLSGDTIFQLLDVFAVHLVLFLDFAWIRGVHRTNNTVLCTTLNAENARLRMSSFRWTTLE